MLSGQHGDLRAADHAGQFLDPPALIEFHDFRHRAVTGNLLRHFKVGVSMARDLCLMSDAQDLIGLGQTFEPLADRFGHAPANPGVNFIKDQCARKERWRGDRLENQHQA